MPRHPPRKAFEDVTFLEAQVVSYKMDNSDGGMWKMTFYVDEVGDADWLFHCYPRQCVVIGVKALDYDNPGDAITTEGEKTLKRASMLCRQHQFQKYIREFCPDENWDVGLEEQACVTGLHSLLSIKSRKELLSNGTAIKEFDQLVKNFQAWMKTVI